MRKSITSLLLAAGAAAIISGCSSIEVSPDSTVPEPGREITLSASVDPSTRTAVDKATGEFTWVSGDAISAFTTDGDAVKLTLESGEGTGDGIFKGTAAGDLQKVAFFPYDARHRADGEDAVFYLPETWSLREDLVPDTRMPMLSRNVSFDPELGSGTLNFKLLGGIFGFKVLGVPSEAAYFQFLTNGKKIAGEFSVNLEAEEPEIIGSNSDEGTAVKVAIPSGNGSRDLEFFIPVPTGKYDILTWRILSSDGRILAEKTYKPNIEIKRKDVILTDDVAYSSAAALGADGLQDFIDNASDDNPDANLTNVLVVARNSKGLIVTDGARFLYIHRNSTPSQKIGDRVNITGKYDTYNNAPQVKNPKITTVSEGNIIHYPEPEDIAPVIRDKDTTKPVEVRYVHLDGTLNITTNAAGTTTYYNVIVPDSKAYGSISYPLSDWGLDDMDAHGISIKGFYQGFYSNYYYVLITEITDNDTGGGSSGGYTEGENAPLEWLRCYEMPHVTLANESRYSKRGMESFGETRWYRYYTTASERSVITHTYARAADGKTTRNYTVLYDTGLYGPVWVAQTMHAQGWPDNGIGREGSWAFDPALDPSEQQTGVSHNAQDFARGHLCASKDRQDCLDANYETFYYTNQTPQWHDGFNSGPWSSLEAYIQKNVPSGTDTLYVVSGTIHNGSDLVESNNGKMVSIPSQMYKCLMLCSFDNNGNMTSAKGAAYIFTNEAHTGENFQYNVTKIDEIETLTGIDFFCNVPQAIQESAENMKKNLW